LGRIRLPGDSYGSPAPSCSRLGDFHNKMTVSFWVKISRLLLQFSDGFLPSVRRHLLTKTASQKSPRGFAGSRFQDVCFVVCLNLCRHRQNAFADSIWTVVSGHVSSTSAFCGFCLTGRRASICSLSLASFLFVFGFCAEMQFEIYLANVLLFALFVCV
jgi:hypothetical protein